VITARASAAVTRRERYDYALLVRAGRANQLSFDTLTTWARLSEALGRLTGAPIAVEPNAHGAVWRFTSARDMDDLVGIVNGVVTTDDWLLRTDDRIEYVGWKKHEIDALVAAWRRAGQ
jgi:hypothetical protein